MNDCLWSFLNICKSCDKCSCDNYVTANSCMAGELLGRMERMEQALRKIASLKPKEKPEWGDATDSGNYDDVEANGWDICAWGVAEIAEQALEGSEGVVKDFLTADHPTLDPRDTTTLTYDENHDNWSCTKCEMAWCFNDGGPKENKINYCPECGRKIVGLKGNEKEVKYQDERLEGIPCANYRCKYGFDKSYEQNCALTIGGGEPFAVVCDQYLPKEGSDPDD